LEDLFDAAAKGKRRARVADLAAQLRKASLTLERAADAVELVPQLAARPRGSVKVYVIDPCYAAPIHALREAGFQIQPCTRIPAGQAMAPSTQQLLEVRGEIEQSRPDVVLGAGQAAACIFGLWQAGYWAGPTVLVNPAPMCQRVPSSSPVVLVSGGQDAKAKLDAQIFASLSSSGCHVHQVDPSTYIGSALSRHDCLPLLLESTLCGDGPQAHMLRAWRERKSAERLEAERWLGYDLVQQRRRWVSAGQMGRDSQKLFAVPEDSEEFRQVCCAFFSGGKEAGAYPGRPGFERTRILRVERVENGLQTDGCTRPYYDALSSALEDQGVKFEPGVHTTWAFHGSSEVDSIISNPMAGVQPLAAGTKSANLWGAGTYFARDASYVVNGCFDMAGSTARSDGTRRIMMFLLMTGIPCLGDPNQKGVLPFRQAPHRFNSSVDSLSNPEIYVAQQSGAAYPGYVITFAPAAPAQ
jgi:hypothetical protein